VGEAPASKQRQEGCFEWRDALEEVGQGPFPADGIPYQQPEKIAGLLAAEASSHQADVLRKSLKQPLGRQVRGNHDDFGEPCRHRRTIKR
jgi:hypothetical protein